MILDIKNIILFTGGLAHRNSATINMFGADPRKAELWIPDHNYTGWGGNNYFE